VSYLSLVTVGSADLVADERLKALVVRNRPVGAIP
jgi:hypothetical protein